jgi:hypothetical protein
MKIILKFDDMMFPFNEQWERLYKILKSRRVYANFGLVTDWCRDDTPELEYIQYWLHGKTHLVDSINQIYEFCNTPPEQQKGNLEQAIIRFKEITKTPILFGPPGNRWDENSLDLVKNLKEIRSVCFCERRHNLPKNCYTIEDNLVSFWKPRQIENGLRVGCERADWNNFKSKLKKNCVIPSHPSFWDEESFNDFEKLLDFLNNYNISPKRFIDVEGAKIYL